MNMKTNKSNMVIRRGPREIVLRVCTWMVWISGAVTLGICVATLVDVLLRLVGQRPLKGLYDCTLIGVLVIIYFSIAYSYSVGAFPRVEIVTRKLPPRIVAVLDWVTYFGGLIGYSIMGLLLVRKGLQDIAKPVGARATELLLIPYGPFILAAAVGVLTLVAVLAFERDFGGHNG